MGVVSNESQGCALRSPLQSYCTTMVSLIASAPTIRTPKVSKHRSSLSLESPLTLACKSKTAFTAEGLCSGRLPEHKLSVKVSGADRRSKKAFVC